MSDKTKTSDLPFFTRMGAYAASACFADFVTFPLDVAKVRLQVQGEIVRGPAGSQVMYRSLFGTITTIAGNEGFKSLYNGLSAGLQRQLCFSSIRLGMYEPVKKFYSQLFYGTESSSLFSSSHYVTKHAIHDQKDEGNTAGDGLNIPLRVAAGLTSGSLSVCLAQPTDVVKIRFQAMTRGNEARRYSSTRDAYLKIYKQEGYNGLWKGTVANATRNAIVNVAEIVVYDTVKDLLIMKGYMNDNIYCHFTTASIAGLTATFVASPVDVIKTRYMNSASGTYKSTLDCAVKTYKKEGFSAFYKGFVPSFYRIATWNIVLWVTFEQAKKLILERQRYRD